MDTSGPENAITSLKSSRRKAMGTGLAIAGGVLLADGTFFTAPHEAHALDNPTILGNGLKRIYGEATTAARYSLQLLY